jgi:membrane protein
VTSSLAQRLQRKKRFLRIRVRAQIATELRKKGVPVKAKYAWSLAKESVFAWLDDYAPSMGAALAYYTVFSMGPLLIIVIAVAGLVFGEAAAQGEVVAQLREVLGVEGALAVQGVLKSVSDPSRGLIATIVSVAVLLVGATSVLAELQSALDRIWKVPVTPENRGAWNFIQVRLWAFGMVLGLGFLLLTSLVISAAIAALGEWWAGWFGGWLLLVQVINFVVSFAIITGAFAMIYKFLPRVTVAWQDVWTGAAVTALMFNVGKFLIGLYLGRSGVATGFGAAGSLVVLLIWVYYSAQIFLLGAEFTRLYAHQRGSRTTGL